jgi:hypothetical protein
MDVVLAIVGLRPLRLNEGEKVGRRQFVFLEHEAMKKAGDRINGRLRIRHDQDPSVLALSQGRSKAKHAAEGNSLVAAGRTDCIRWRCLLATAAE